MCGGRRHGLSHGSPSLVLGNLRLLRTSLPLPALLRRFELLQAALGLGEERLVVCSGERVADEPREVVDRERRELSKIAVAEHVAEQRVEAVTRRAAGPCQIVQAAEDDEDSRAIGKGDGADELLCGASRTDAQVDERHACTPPERGGECARIVACPDAERDRSAENKPRAGRRVVAACCLRTDPRDPVATAVDRQDPTREAGPRGHRHERPEDILELLIGEQLRRELPPSLPGCALRVVNGISHRCPSSRLRNHRTQPEMETAPLE